MITLIAAMTKKNVIGKDGKILWKLQEEEKGFNLEKSLLWEGVPLRK